MQSPNGTLKAKIIRMKRAEAPIVLQLAILAKSCGMAHANLELATQHRGQAHLLLRVIYQLATQLENIKKTFCQLETVNGREQTLLNLINTVKL